MSTSQINYHTIILPVRPQPDTIVAIFLLKQLGNERFPGVVNARYAFWPTLPIDQTSDQLLAEGYILIDLGGGIFDHHNKTPQTTATALVCQYLEIADQPSLAKLLAYTERDDFYGKGTLSDDALDRAFGLSGLIATLNKNYPTEPERVITTVLPLLTAHYHEEKRRLEAFPAEVAEKKFNHQFIEFPVKQRDKNLKVAMLQSNNVGLPGYLRSQLGGRYDVVAQKTDQGFVNILTRPTKRIDLRSLVALIRLKEADKNARPLKEQTKLLTLPGRIEEVKNWYYDTATNSLLNGGMTPSPEIQPTKIAWLELQTILELGLSEQLMRP